MNDIDLAKLSDHDLEKEFDRRWIVARPPFVGDPDKRIAAWCAYKLAEDEMRRRFIDNPGSN